MIEIVRAIPEDELLTLAAGIGMLEDTMVKPYADAEISLRELSLDSIQPTTLYVLRQNLAFQQKLDQELSQLGQSPYELEGGLVLEQNGVETGLIPPIVEADPDYGDCLLDGAHRAFNARAAGRMTMKVLYIQDVNPTYPIYATPNNWEDIVEFDSVPADPEQKKHYRTENPRSLYRDFGKLNSSRMRS